MSEPGDLDDLLTINEAAAIVGVHPLTLRRYVSAGRLPGYRLGPRSLRVRRSDLGDLLRQVPAATPRRGRR